MLNENKELPVQYESSGLFVAQGNWIHPDRIISSYEIMFVLEGEVHIQEEEAVYSLKKDDLLMLHPARRHFGCRESKAPVSFYWVHFYTCLPGLPGLLKPQDSYVFHQYFRQLLHLVNTPGYPGYMADSLAGLIVGEVQYLQREHQAGGSSLAGQIAEWVRLNIDRNISVKMAAEHFGYHENYIGKLFQQAFGVGMKEYINNEKIKAAKNYLRTTNDSVKQIAHRLGYRDQNLFVKFFRYHEQISPTKFRNLYFHTHMNKS